MQLTKSEIEQARLPDDLFRWVRDVYVAFGASPAGRSTFRLRQGSYLKQFHDEIWPLASYAHLFHKGKRDILFKPVLGNQPYDALLLSADPPGVQNHIEITTALNGEAGHQEHLRTLHLEQHGNAPVTGFIPPRDRLTKKIPETYGDAVRHDKARDAELTQIERAVLHKAAKRYPPNTVLVVEFRSLHFAKPEDRDRLRVAGDALFNRISDSFIELSLVDVQAEFGHQSCRR